MVVKTSALIGLFTTHELALQAVKRGNSQIHLKKLPVEPLMSGGLS